MCSLIHVDQYFDWCSSPNGFGAPALPRIERRRAPQPDRFAGGQAPPRTDARPGARGRRPAPRPHAPGGKVRAAQRRERRRPLSAMAKAELKGEKRSGTQRARKRKKRA
ncbi:hypothetical protein GCM10009727_55370 [Actinomadura napierensis]|uniref:Uncharacterized protein n=1 Tax=Actinomadura napierensis TaxID=267854 RepID=A0ABN2ZZN0_9ACTN